MTLSAPVAPPSDLTPGDASAIAAKPRLRGWIHAVTAPLAVAAASILIVLSTTAAHRIACAVFALTSAMLFTISATYHLGTWSPRTIAVLRRLDHANIFLIIAGTYTPLVVMLLPAHQATVLLWVVWLSSLVGVASRVFWLGAPRWLYVPMYGALGWVAIAYVDEFWRAGSPAIAMLVMIGGLAYSLGAVVYGIKRPNPSLRWFGFHEVFHALTVVGFTCHFIAIMLATLQS